jgi:hypothetical protein
MGIETLVPKSHEQEATTTKSNESDFRCDNDLDRIEFSHQPLDKETLQINSNY